MTKKCEGVLAMYQLLIKNGKIVTPEDSYKANLYVQDGKIAAITGCDTCLEAETVYDASGKCLYPGFIDTHVHSRDGGATQKEDFWHSTRAAACGGITTLLEMPNAVPAVVDVDHFYQQRENLQSKAYIDYGMWALCLGDLNKGDLEALNQEGVVGFKFFWGYAIRKDNFNLIYSPKAGDDNVIPPLEDGEVYRIFQEVAKTGKELAIHAENANLIRSLSAELKEEDFPNAYEALLAQRPILAELSTTQQAIAFARETGCHLHILHVTAKAVVEAIREAQAEGVPVTAETCPHYLFLTNQHYEKVGNMMKCYPPVRYQEDQEALWQGLLDGTLDHVCSDHAPHTKKDKEGCLAEVPAGMCVIENMVSLMATAVNEGKITENQLAALLSEQPARHYGLYPQKGSLLVGTDADITIMDFEKKGRIEAEKLHSVSKVTPFDGFEVKGLPVATFLRGVLIAKEGEPVLEQPMGTFLAAK